jgi:hypothetical protein
MRNPFKSVINRVKNFVREVANVQTHSSNPTQPTATTSRPVRRHNSPWWRRLYHLKTRSETTSNNLQPIKGFGNFAPCKPFAQPKGKK